MKISILLLTVQVHFLCIVELKLLDRFSLIAGILVASLIVGCICTIADTKKRLVYQFGWGLFYGSFISLSLTSIFMIWLSSNFPK